jgi:hypothetical protein
MHFSARLGAICSLIFGGMCLWLAFDGFATPAQAIDADRLSGGRSYAWFWTLLAAVSFITAWFSWRVRPRD